MSWRFCRDDDRPWLDDGAFGCSLSLIFPCQLQPVLYLGRQLIALHDSSSEPHTFYSFRHVSMLSRNRFRGREYHTLSELQQSPCPQIDPCIGGASYPQASPLASSGIKIVLSEAAVWSCTDGEAWTPAKAGSAGNNFDVKDLIADVGRRALRKQTYRMGLGMIFSRNEYGRRELL